MFNSFSCQIPVVQELALTFTCHNGLWTILKMVLPKLYIWRPCECHCFDNSEVHRWYSLIIYFETVIRSIYSETIRWPNWNLNAISNKQTMNCVHGNRFLRWYLIPVVPFVLWKKGNLNRIAWMFYALNNVTSRRTEIFKFHPFSRQINSLPTLQLHQLSCACR